MMTTTRGGGRQMPNWKHSVEAGGIVADDTLSFEEKRDRIVERLKAVNESDPEYLELVMDLGNAFDVEEFDLLLEDLFDWGDEDNRLWLQLW